MLIIQTGLLFLLIIQLNLSHVYGDNVNSIIASNDAQASSSALQKSIAPFYDLMNIFLQAVQPAAVNQLDAINLYGLFSAYNSNTTSQSQLQNNIFMSSAQYVRYVILFLVGLLFLLILPIVGIFFCFCRFCCARCGNQIKAMDHKNSRCQRNTFGIILGILATIMLIGVVIMYINNSLFRVALTNEQDGFVASVNSSLTTLSIVFGEAAQDLLDNAHNAMNKLAFQINPIGNASLSIFSANLQRRAETNQAFLGINSLVSNFTQIDIAMNYINNRRSKYTTLYVDLKSNRLLMLQKNLSSEFDTSGGTVGFLGVSSQLIVETKSLIDRFIVTQKLNNINFDGVQNVLSNANYSNVNMSAAKISIVQATNSIQNISNHAYDVIQPQITSIINVLNSTKNLNALLQQAVDGLNTLSSTFNNLSLAFNSIQIMTPSSKNQPLKSAISQYEEVLFYVFLALGVICLAIIACYYIGLLFGCLGEPPYEDAGICNRDVGANFLMGGVALSFIFGWLIMLIVMLLFFPGALLYTESCRYLTNETNDNANALLLLDKALQNITLNNVPIVSVLSGGSLPSSARIVSGILNNCSLNNVTLLNVLNLQSSIDLSNLTQFVTQYVEDASKNLKGISFREFVTVYPLVLKNEMTKVNLVRSLISQLAQSVMPSITELQNFVDPIVYSSLTNNLYTVIFQLSDQTSAPKKDTITALMNTLNAAVNEIQLEADILSRNFLVINTTLLLWDDVVNQLSVSNNSLLAPSYIEESSDLAIDKFVNSLNQQFPIAVDNLLAVSDCKNVNDFALRMVQIFCKSLLNPFNTLWFGLGWFLLFVIPALIFAVKLNNLYRKAIEYEKDYENEPTGISFYEINDYEC